MLIEELKKEGETKLSERLRTLAVRHREAQLPETTVLALIGVNVCRMRQPGYHPRATAEFFLLFESLYEESLSDRRPPTETSRLHLLGTPAGNLRKEIPVGLFPQLEGRAFKFNATRPASHFGAFIFHPDSDFRQNVHKVTFETPKSTRISLGQPVWRWMLLMGRRSDLRLRDGITQDIIKAEMGKFGELLKKLKTSVLRNSRASARHLLLKLYEERHRSETFQIVLGEVLALCESLREKPGFESFRSDFCHALNALDKEKRQHFYVRAFQEWVSGRLSYRQNAFLAEAGTDMSSGRAGPAVPMLLIWVEGKSDQKLELVRQLKRENLPENVFLFRGPLASLVDAYLDEQAELTDRSNVFTEHRSFLDDLNSRLKAFCEKFAAPNWRDNSYFKELRTQEADSQKAARLLLQFFFPLVYFGNAIVISGQYNPPQIPFCLSFNFSVDLKGKERDLLHWSSVAAVAMQELLSETTSVLNDAALAALKRTQGESAGESRTFHDYAKDLNALDIQLADYDELLNKAREVIQGCTAQIRSSNVDQNSAVLADRIDEMLGRLRQPQLDWMLRLRFMMSHLRTQTESRLYEQPEWCMKFLRGGTRRDLYRLIKVLVWIPVGYRGYKNLEREAELERLEDPSTWGRLFAFESAGRSSEGQALTMKLGSFLQRLFIAEKISEQDFATTLPPPTLNVCDGLDRQILWVALDGGTLGERWLPLRGLLPLLVFSLRAAFQHAWLRTALDAADGARGSTQNILISCERLEKGLLYLIHIDFPHPLKEVQVSGQVSNLPYGDWWEQISHYRGLTHPWSPQRDSFIETETGQLRLRITLRAEA